MKTTQDEMDLFASAIGVTMYKLIHNRDILIGVISTFLILVTIVISLFINMLFTKIDTLENKILSNNNKAVKTVINPPHLMRHNIFNPNKQLDSILDDKGFKVLKVYDGDKRRMVWTRKDSPEITQWYTYAIVK